MYEKDKFKNESEIKSTKIRITKKKNINEKENIFNNIKSKFIIKIIFKNIKKEKYYNIIRYNQKIQNRLNIGLIDYKKLSQKNNCIEIYFSKETVINKDTFNFIWNSNCYHFYNDDEELDFNSKNNITVSRINLSIDFEVKSLIGLFKDQIFISKINLSKFKIKDIVDTSDMFANCSSLKELNLSNFNTDKVVFMNRMFKNCSSLTTLDLSNFNTKNVTVMYRMFEGCKSLKELNLSGFNTDKVVDMSNMFSDCTSLIELNLSNFNTDKATYMQTMFYNCKSLKKLSILNLVYYGSIEQLFDIKNSPPIIELNISNVKLSNKNKSLFRGLPYLTILKISKIEITDLTDTSYMFKGCKSLKSLDLSDFNTEF